MTWIGKNQTKWRRLAVERWIRKIKIAKLKQASLPNNEIAKIRSHKHIQILEFTRWGANAGATRPAVDDGIAKET